MNVCNYFLYYLGLIIMIMSGTIYGVSGFESYQPVLLALSIVIISISIGKIFLIPKYKNIVTTIFLLFILFIAVSFIEHPESSMIITVLGLILLAYIFFVQIPDIKRNKSFDYKLDIRVIIISLLSVQIFSLSRSFSFYRFAGIFSNSNFNGGEAATLCAVSCAAFLQSFLSKDERREIILPTIAIVLSVVICLATNSRTSVATIILMIFTMIIFILRMSTDRVLLKRIIILVLLVSLMAYFLFQLPFVKAAIEENIIKITLRRGNELAGRQDRWNIVFGRLKFWGNGEATAFGTHNTYLSMLDQYGYIPFVLLIIFVLIGLFYSVKLALINDSIDMKYLPLFCFMCFGITCMFEQMLLKNIMLLCLYSVPILTQYKEYKKTKYSNLVIINNDI